MKRIPVQIQLFLILFLVLVIPMSIITYYTTNSMMKYSEEEIAEQAMSRMNSNSELTELSLNNVLYDVLRLVKENKFNQVKNITSYDELNKDYDRINEALTIMNEMNKMQSNKSIVYSMFFYMDDADYVFSSNKGIVRLANFESMDWLNDIQYNLNGANGVWYPRILNTATITEIENGTDYSTTIPVISFVYRLSRLTTSVKGTIVVNVRENEISSLLNSGNNGEYTLDYLIDSKGSVISHKDKSLLFTDFSNRPYIRNIINSETSSGYDFIDNNGERMLYTYRFSSFSDWIHVTTYSMDSLMEKTKQVTTSYILLTIAIIAIGTIVTVIVSTKFSKPIRQLIKNMQGQVDLSISDTKNEWAYLTEAFNKIKEEENNLHQLLKTRVKETKSLAIHKLLTGEVTNETELEELKKIFPFNHFLIALVSTDNYKAYLNDTNQEIRYYQRYMLIEQYEKAFPEEYKVCASRYESGVIAIIINIEHFDQGRVSKTLNGILNNLKNETFKIRGNTVTIGVSGVHTAYSGVKDCIFEAQEAINQRLIKGTNSIIFWDPNKKDNKKLYYFYNSEKKIINYLANGDIDNIKVELGEIIRQINESEDISKDNILLIFNQLVGATMKFLVEHNLNTNKVLKSNVNIYSIIANMDTLDEIEAYLIEVYQSISCFTAPIKDMNETNYFDKVMNYIKEHYNEDLVFEDVASKIGISYSYLRKLVKDETGKSLIDNLNLIRIEEVKHLLLQTDLTISEIAKEVGYRNIQSVNRFFKKYEGISPSEFKSLKRKSLE